MLVWFLPSSHIRQHREPLLVFSSRILFLLDVGSFFFSFLWVPYPYLADAGGGAVAPPWWLLVRSTCMHVRSGIPVSW